jgi:phytoene dehydrogenase-like protein
LPDELGTGFGMFLMPGLMHGYGVSQPVGGSGKLSESLVRCIEHYGGEVRCNAEVRQVLTSAAAQPAWSSRAASSSRPKTRSSAPSIRTCCASSSTACPSRCCKRAERATLAAFSLMVSHYDLKQQAIKFTPARKSARHHARVHGERYGWRHAR